MSVFQKICQCTLWLIPFGTQLTAYNCSESMAARTIARTSRNR